MKNQNKKNLWQYRKATTPTPAQKTVLAIFIVAGVLSILRLFNWWFKEENIVSVPLFILLSLIFWWGMIRMVILWISYLKIRVPETKARS
jgi:cellulose synthase (UDP-forming)